MFAFGVGRWTLDVGRFSEMVAIVDNRLQTIRAAFPKEGLLAEKEWLLSPDAFPIDKKFLADLEQLGHRLFVFQRACNQLYQLSVKGKQPGWIARYLDAGKPKELIEFSRRKEIRESHRVAQSDIFKIRQCDHWGYERYAGWISFRGTKRRRHCHLAGIGNLPAGDGMDRGAIEGTSCCSRRR